MNECPLTTFRIIMYPNSDESGKQSLYPEGDPDRHQNLITCSVAHCQPSLKISCKSVRKFLRKVANRETDIQTDNDDYISSLAEVNTVRSCVNKRNTLLSLFHSCDSLNDFIQPLEKKQLLALWASYASDVTCHRPSSTNKVD